jgi:hypothetical protein
MEGKGRGVLVIIVSPSSMWPDNQPTNQPTNQHTNPRRLSGRTCEVVPVGEEPGLDGVQLHVELGGARDGGGAREADGAGCFLRSVV